MLRDEDAIAPAEVKVRVKVETEDEDEKNIKMKVEKPQRVHAIAGGRTDEELETFYRVVHRKLAAHYPGTWLLVKEEKDRKMKNEKNEDEEDQMSEEEEEKELEKEEKEMDKVEEKVKAKEQEDGDEEAEVVVKIEQPPTPQRRNPDRRKRAKLEIKIENEEVDEGADESQDDKKARGKKTKTTAAAKAAVAAAAKQSGKGKTNVCGGQKTVLASLISTVLSQNTTDRNSSAAWANLQRAYNGDWERVRTAKLSQLADVIRTGGLAQRKGGIIQGLLNQLHQERDGDLSLEHLRDLPTEEVKRELTKYKGIGPKTASCVLMFNMKRADFPVDTHVHRVSTRLGFVRGTTREQTYEFMNATMPDEIKRDMHVLLIRHGKQICKARAPKCGECFLRDDCRYGQTLKKEREMGDDEEVEEELDEEEAEEEEEEREQLSRATSKRTRESSKRNAKGRRSADGRAQVTSPGAGNGGDRRAAKRRRRSAPASVRDIEDAA